jgi:hypothetical protein
MIEKYRKEWERMKVENDTSDLGFLVCKLTFAKLFIIQERCDDALPLLVECLQHQTDLLGANHDETINTMDNLASCSGNTEKWQLAEPLNRRRLELLNEKYSEMNQIKARAMLTLASTTKNLEEAEQLLLQCIQFNKSGYDSRGVYFAIYEIPLLLRSQLYFSKKASSRGRDLIRMLEDS